ncbi:MAG: hypothetical protein ACKVG6_06710 [Alphaproteobacteria bacterium]|jgi:hypothetical protein
MADPFMNQQSIKDLVLRWHEVDLEDGAADRLVALVNLHAETFNEYAKQSFFDTEPSNFDRMLEEESRND